MSIMASDRDPSEPSAPPAPHWLRRLWPVLLVAAVAGIVMATGVHKHLAFETLAQHYFAIRGFVSSNLASAVVVYIALYVAVVALSVPGAAFLTVAGGIVLGGIVGGIATVVGATAGATLIFMIARSALGEHLARRAGPTVGKLVQGFRADAFHYLLFLRLVPLFPFWLVNIVPALAGVPLMTFVVATAIGIVPGTFAFAFVGAGLDSVVEAQAAALMACVDSGRTDCRVHFDLKSAVTPEILTAIALLGVAALIPVVVKRIRARSRVPDPSG